MLIVNWCISVVDCCVLFGVIRCIMFAVCWLYLLCSLCVGCCVCDVMLLLFVAGCVTSGV